jgi:hypothetical protein
MTPCVDAMSIDASMTEPELPGLADTASYGVSGDVCAVCGSVKMKQPCEKGDAGGVCDMDAKTHEALALVVWCLPQAML